MTGFAITPSAQVSVAIHGSDTRFPVRRIFCVGRNYAAHAREMGKDPEREAPFFFTKPADAVVDTGSPIPYPPETTNFHYEIELVVAIGRGGTGIGKNSALDHVWGYGVGIDLTRRDLQQVAKDMGRPWDLGKGFDRSAPCAPLYPVAESGHLATGRIWLSVNSRIEQDGDLDELIWSVPEVISILSNSVTLAAGDLIYTGTPAGVGPVVAGDHIQGGIDGLGEIQIDITE